MTTSELLGHQFLPDDNTISEIYGLIDEKRPIDVLGDDAQLYARRHHGQAHGTRPPQAQSAVNNNFIMNPLNNGRVF